MKDKEVKSEASPTNDLPTIPLTWKQSGVYRQLRDAEDRHVAFMAMRDDDAVWADFLVSRVNTTTALYEALKELLNYGVEFDDVRMSYVVAQVDRGAISDARAALAAIEATR